jgi:hypothetical protein
MSKLGFIDDALADLREKGLYNTIRTIESSVGAWVTIDGKRVLNMCSNNYLGFANDPRLCRAAKRAIDEYGVGPGAVRSIAGTMTLHVELERRISQFKGTEAALSVQSGLNTNLATIPLLMDKDDILFTDELNHASIIDGVRLTKAQRAIYPHRDVDALARLLEENRSIAKKLIITDGVFSMDGDLAPLPGIVEVAERTTRWSWSTTRTARACSGVTGAASSITSACTGASTLSVARCPRRSARWVGTSPGARRLSSICVSGHDRSCSRPRPLLPTSPRASRRSISSRHPTSRCAGCGTTRACSRRLSQTSGLTSG